MRGKIIWIHSGSEVSTAFLSEDTITEETERGALIPVELGYEDGRLTFDCRTRADYKRMYWHMILFGSRASLNCSYHTPADRRCLERMIRTAEAMIAGAPYVYQGYRCSC